jgi:5-methylcytosine-specific restriction protein A
VAHMVRATGFSVVVKALIRDRAAGCCEVCGFYSSDCVAHHRRARGMGSTKRPETNLPSNALWVCALDHNRIESHRSAALDNGWLVHQGANPGDVPVLRRGVWCLLLDDGSVMPSERESA